MELKTVEVEGVTYAAIQDGKPLYMDGDKEVAVDAANTRETVSRLNAESKAFRERAEKAETGMKAYEGITDPDAALKALEAAKNLKDGELVTIGKVEELKAAAKHAAEEQVAAAQKSADERISTMQTSNEALTAQLHGELVGGSFARSVYAKESLSIPADMVQSRFGQHFTIESGKMIAKDTSGNEIYSRANPGEKAGFDEALEILVDQYPSKSYILKGTGGGSGSTGSTGSGGGDKTFTRAEFDALGGADRAAKLKDGFKIV